MAEQQSHRSHLRDASGPRAVDPNGDGTKARGSSRRHRDHSDREKPHSRRSDSIRSPKSSSKKESPKTEGGHRRKQSTSPSLHLHYENPALELEIVRQPPSAVQLGLTVGQIVVVSLKGSSHSHEIETSSLFTVTSLVADTRSGERLVLEAGYLVGQTSLDSVHPLPQDYVERYINDDPCRLPLGFSSFADLLIRQHGVYRIRTTLMKMGAGGATTMHAVDSDPIKVERLAIQRRTQKE